MQVLVNGSDLVTIPPAIAQAFQPGDRLIALPDGALLHIPHLESKRAREAVDRAEAAFQHLAQADSNQVTHFFDAFALRLEDPRAWGQIEAANRLDVETAQQSGRSTTRLRVSETMCQAMAAGLREWRDAPSSIGRVIETTRHDGWLLDHVISPLGIVAFVFEGRPNVFADAAGVLRSGNTTVMRIGRDALGTAQAILDHALQPALAEAGLPAGSVSLVESRDHASGWALFSDPRISLAVARGSGPATRQLGAVARQAGIPASLHGTGGAWMAVDASADRDRLYQVVYHSIDRKVCNTLNTVCLVESASASLAAVVVQALHDRDVKTGCGYRIHAAPAAEKVLEPALFDRLVPVRRAGGVVDEPAASPLAEEDLGREWEWEGTPEISITIVRDLDHAADLFNRYSPRFIACCLTADQAAEDRFFSRTEAPFFGDGFTRWVDGQFALQRPELGLSNWQNGRLLGRSGILTGESIYSVRLRVRQSDPAVHR